MSPLTLANPVRLISSQNSTSDSLDAGTGTGLQVFATTYAIPASLFRVGQRIRVTANMDLTGNGTVPTLQCGMRVQKSGPTNVSLFLDGAVAPSVSSGATRGYAMEFMLIVTAVGASGTIECEPLISSKNPGVNTVNQATIPATLDMTAAQTLQFTAQWGTATAGNIARLRSLDIEAMN